MRRRRLLIHVSLIVLTLGVFGQARRFDFVDFDDNRYVFENPHVFSGLTASGFVYAFTTLESGNWHPLTWLSLMLDTELWGRRSGGFHMTNVLLHLASTLLLFEFLRRMNLALGMSAFVAALFAVHPLHVESVAWVAERKDVLSTFFGFIALWCYARHAERPEARWLLAAGIGFMLSLMAKQTLVTLPFLLLLLDDWPLRREAPMLDSDSQPDIRQGTESAAAASAATATTTEFRIPQRMPQQLLREKIPFFLVAAVFCVVAYWSQQAGGNVVPTHRLSLLDRLANACLSYGIYLRKLVWPVDLAVFYPHPRDALSFPAAIAVGAALLAVTAVVTWQRRRRPWLFVGWLWYLGTFVPLIGIVQIGNHQLADRYTYIPLIGIFLAIAGCGQELAQGNRHRQKVIVGFAIVVILAAADAAHRQVATWRNTLTLFEHALAVTENNQLAHSRLGHALHAEGRYEEAFTHIRQSSSETAEAHTTMARLFLEQGNTDAAVPHLRAALRNNPNWLEADELLSNLPRQSETAP